jgi:hypothetical protein
MGTPRPAGTGGLRQTFIDRLLALVDRGVGGGEAVPDAEWEALRASAVGTPRSLELVGRLRAVVAECNREIEARRAKGEEVDSLRQEIVEYVRGAVTEQSPPAGGGRPGA